jgi:hypothetical protein
MYGYRVYIEFVDNVKYHSPRWGLALLEGYDVDQHLIATTPEPLKTSDDKDWYIIELMKQCPRKAVRDGTPTLDEHEAVQHGMPTLDENTTLLARARVPQADRARHRQAADRHPLLCARLRDNAQAHPQEVEQDCQRRRLSVHRRRRTCLHWARVHQARRRRGAVGHKVGPRSSGRHTSASQ